MRLLFSALCVALFTAPVAAKDVTIRWHGQSFFEVVTGDGGVIAIDPHNIEAYGSRSIKADLILVSHLHTDHCTFTNIENFAKTTTLYGIKNKDGVVGDRKKDEFNILDETIKEGKLKGVKIQTVGTYHDEFQGMVRGLNSVLIIETDGIRLCHLGDLGHKLTPAQLKKIGKVDVLMIPVGGVYTINGKTAREVVDQIKPTRLVFPMHRGTDVYDDLLNHEEFVEEFDKKLPVKEEKFNELVFAADRPAPKEPTIVLLNHKQKEK